MSRRLQMLIAWIFTLINLGGGIYAAVNLDIIHCLVHVALFGAGVYWLRHLPPRAVAANSLGTREEERFERLEQSLDVINSELQRIGEGQQQIAHLERERVSRERSRG